MAISWVLLLGVLHVSLGQLLVNTTYGPIIGKDSTTTKTVEFLGVPFAAPPVGERRWRDPQAPTPWETPRDATKFAADCAQLPNGYSNNTSEDCLYLSIWTPSLTPSEPLSVMVWLHGGAFVNGSSSFFIYYGGRLAAKHNVIVVSLNYRLGIFGFLGSESMRSRTSDGSVGNYALQDQQMAFKWVQANIAQFGGDPNKVTVFGESAGAASVALHMLAPSSSGLFQRGIMESGTSAFWARRKITTADIDFGLIAANAECKRELKEDSLECLLSKTTEELLLASKSSLWFPTIDGVFLPDDPVAMAERGDFSNKVPAYTGFNKDEGTMFALTFGTEIEEWFYQTVITTLFGLDGLITINVLYPQLKYKSAWWALADVLGDWAFVCPSRRMARALHRADIPVWQYFFTQNNTRFPSMLSHKQQQPRLGGAPCMGTCHAMEIPYVFCDHSQLDNEADIVLSNIMSNFWREMAQNGAPDPTWPAYESESDTSLEFGAHVAPISSVHKAKCDFMDGKEAEAEAAGHGEDPMMRFAHAFDVARMQGPPRA